MALVAVMMLAACSPEANHTPTEQMVPCAHGGAPLSRSCRAERTMSSRGVVLTLRNPDGGFHRLLMTRDGRGLVAADGALSAKVMVVGPDLIEVAIEGDRYRLPAVVRK